MVYSPVSLFIIIWSKHLASHKAILGSTVIIFIFDSDDIF